MCRHQGHAPTSAEDRMAAREIVPAGALIFTDARTFTSEQRHLVQLLEKLQEARQACIFKHVLWQVCVPSRTQPKIFHWPPIP